MLLCRLFGEFIEWLKGPSETTVVSGETRHQSATVSYVRGELHLEITSHRIIYLIRYPRSFWPNVKRAIFEVEGRVLSGDANGVNPKLLERVIFPNLSSRGLLHTEYPHVRAIGAYLDRLSVDGASVILA